MKNVADTSSYKDIPNDFPIYFVSGGDDPVGGEVISKVAEDYSKAGLENVEYKIYPKARHELINELNKDEFFSDIIDWLGKNNDVSA
jgi:alpha-beta hydrolase superfamily lysophospholipase